MTHAVGPAFAGVDLSPYWLVAPAGTPPAPTDDGVPRILLGAGPGFGSGEHPTTQLCLLGLGFLLRRGWRPAEVLDFGAGSGVLSIAAARGGARVTAVEIDARAVETGRANARLNGVEARVSFTSGLPEPPRPVDLVLANVLRPILVAHADALCARLRPDGVMILSGLLGTDVPEMVDVFSARLAPRRAARHARREWHALVFAPT